MSRHLLPLGRCLLRGRGCSLARSAAFGRRLRPGRGVRLGSAALGYVRLRSAGLGWARQAAKTAEDLASREAGGGPRPVGGWSHLRAAAVIQLASCASLSGDWSRAGVGLDRPWCRRGAGARIRVEGLRGLDPSGRKGWERGPPTRRDFLHLQHLGELHFQHLRKASGPSRVWRLPVHICLCPPYPRGKSLGPHI